MELGIGLRAKQLREEEKTGKARKQRIQLASNRALKYAICGHFPLYAHAHWYNTAPQSESDVIPPTTASRLFVLRVGCTLNAAACE